MAYSDFSLVEIKRKFQLIIEEDADLYSTTPERSVSAWLAETLQETLPLVLAINTEKVRSELIIAPILVELRKQTGRSISFFSGVDFTVDPTQGLNGVCDYIVSLSPEQLFVNVPVLIIFEAKNENIKGEFAQCISAMIAAQLFNEREGNNIPTIHGVVTTGTNWRFLQLEQKNVRIDQREYYIDNVEKILGILLSITGTITPATKLAA
ncbi:MAG TPA: hypothetical protein VF511_01375 [Chthoniobacterales bacterium]